MRQKRFLDSADLIDKVKRGELRRRLIGCAIGETFLRRRIFNSITENPLGFMIQTYHGTKTSQKAHACRSQ